MDFIISCYLIIGLTMYITFILKKVKLEGGRISVFLFILIGWPIIVYMIYRAYKNQ